MKPKATSEFLETPPLEIGDNGLWLLHERLVYSSVLIGIVIVPEGYHPTCGMPGVKSCYFWVMAAQSPESRRYDLAENDPNFG